MDWDLDDSRSIYPQLKELIKRGIITGEYAPGSAFPTVRELASDAGVNRNTMQRAMAELESEGLLITNRTAGRTVTTDLSLIEQMRRELAEQQVDTFLQEMRSLGYSLQGALAEVAARAVRRASAAQCPRATGAAQIVETICVIQTMLILQALQMLWALQKQRTPRMAQRVKMRKRKGIMTYEIGNFSTM